jgi:hypothetical protein
MKACEIERRFLLREGKMSLLLLLLVLLEPSMKAWFWVGTEADFDVGFAGFGVGQVGEKGVGV